MLRIKNADNFIQMQSNHVYLNCRNEGPLPYGNIMYDRRIIRGNTYAQHTLPAVSNEIMTHYNETRKVIFDLLPPQPYRRAEGSPFPNVLK